MKSPITGKQMELRKETRNMEFRKEKFDVVFHFYYDNDLKEQFTDTKLDELNMNQLYNKYRERHNLPFPEEIRAIREQYDLPATKMSEVLGFGINSYRHYEAGEVPSAANGKLIQLAANPKRFRDLLELCETCDERTKTKTLKRIEYLIQENKQALLAYEEHLLDGHLPDEYTGYRKSSYNRFKEMVVFFTEQLKPWKTQLNKLLFYADFLNYKRTGYSISGARYRAINMGPVPNNFNSIFEHIYTRDYVDVIFTEFPNGSIGEQFKPNKNYSFNNTLFDENELNVLKDVVAKFKGIKTNKVIEISHKEKAWKENEKGHKLINYKYAFELTEI
ncbi:MAG: type II toxin-antitoxin system antitoxin SocA domain-containing protein [Bacteroidia bacterium]